jgi:hypothetical protein
MTLDDIKDLSISIVNELVLCGYIKDCTDTDNETEFEVQDIVLDVLAKRFNIDLND